MKKKIIGILVCMLLITAVLPAVSSIDIKDSNQPYHEIKEDLSSKYPVMIDPPLPLDPNDASQKPNPIDTPDEFSWKDYDGDDWTTPARNQGSCGSCWDFAAIGVLESIIKIREGCTALDPDLSEQYVMSCLPEAGSCRGGSPTRAFELIMDTTAEGNYHNGIIPESCFPYQADDDVPCSDKCSNWEEFLIPISDYGYWEPDGSPGDREAIKTQIIQTGPVAVGITATDALKTWGAVIHNPTSYYPYFNSGDRINHIVVIVGWKDSSSIRNGGYWIVKNSWGEEWGYDGFFNIEYGSLNIDNYIAVWVDYDPESVDWPYESTNPPDKPTITGPTSGEAGTAYTYIASTMDPDGDQMYYLFDWGDHTNSGWLGPYDSGKEVNEKHIWSVQGNYNIKVKAKDIHDAVSEWADPLPISMPKTKPYINTLFLQILEQLLQRFPLLAKLLQPMFNKLQNLR